MDVYHEKDELRLEQGRDENLLGLFPAAFMVLMAVLMACGVGEMDDGMRVVLPIVFFCMGVGFTYYSIAMSGYELHIGADGIREVYRRGFKRERRLAWDEIADWGYAYYGRVRYGKLYVLYFSPVPLADKKKGKKELPKTTIYTQMFASEVERKVERDILPFCRRFTDVAPNIPEKK